MKYTHGIIVVHKSKIDKPDPIKYIKLTDISYFRGYTSTPKAEDITALIETIENKIQLQFNIEEYDLLFANDKILHYYNSMNNYEEKND